MTEPARRRRPFSTIAGWMILIAVIAGTMAAMVLSPFVFILAVLVLMEWVTAVRYREARRRKPMSGWAELGWILGFLVVAPLVSIVASVVALSAYCTVNPNAWQ